MSIDTLEDTAPALLLRDLQHRISDDLQFLLAVMELQVSQAKGPETRAAFHALLPRVEALAAVYRRLHAGGTAGLLDLGAYLDGLVANLARFHDANRRVDVVVDCAPLLLGPDRAVPLGLIVGELVVNAYKHAFGGLGGGRIEVTARLADGGHLVVAVADDGWGFGGRPPEEAGRGRLGLILVRTLARRIRGTLAVESGDGVRVRLTLPMGAAG